MSWKFFNRGDKTKLDQEQSALDFALCTAGGLQKKANHNKRESLLWFGLIVIGSLVNLLFLNFGTNEWLNKFTPSLLSIAAAGGATWLQLRKPHSLWEVYRDCQRKLEDHITKFRFRLDEYDTDSSDRNRLLADATRAIAMEAHTRWLPLIPKPETLIRGATHTHVPDASGLKSSARKSSNLGPPAPEIGSAPPITASAGAIKLDTDSSDK